MLGQSAYAADVLAKIVDQRPHDRIVRDIYNPSVQEPVFREIERVDLDPSLADRRFRS
jgi:hypothetical protein